LGPLLLRIEVVAHHLLQRQCHGRDDIMEWHAMLCQTSEAQPTRVSPLVLWLLRSTVGKLPSCSIPTPHATHFHPVIVHWPSNKLPAAVLTRVCKVLLCIL
jgi:hypothetical protein